MSSSKNEALGRVRVAAETLSRKQRTRTMDVPGFQKATRELALAQIDAIAAGARPAEVSDASEWPGI